jgi:transcriptional regulator with XRE-family HTH domain
MHAMVRHDVLAGKNLADKYGMKFFATVKRVPEIRHHVSAPRDNRAMDRPADFLEFTTLGKRVRGWREFRGLSQEQLATKAGLKNKTSVSTIERDASDKPEAKTIFGLADALEVDPAYLFKGDGDPEVRKPLSALAQIRFAWPFSDAAWTAFQRLSPKERDGIELPLLHAIIESEQRHAQPEPEAEPALGSASGSRRTRRLTRER